MSRLTWGQANKRKVEAGISRGVLYVDGGKGVPWNGLISITSSPDGAEDNDLYADNFKYGRLKSAEAYQGSIEAYTYPEEFGICDGSYSVIPGLSIGQQKRAMFNLCYRTEKFSANSRESGYKLHLVYNASVSPAEKSYETLNDSPDAMTFSWDFTTTPVKLEGYKPFSEIVLDSESIDRLNLSELTKILYGLGEDDPAMPNPDFILTLIDMNKVARMIMDVISLHNHWLWDTFNFVEDTVQDAIDRESERHVFKNGTSETEYIQPSVAYSLYHADKSEQVYFVEVIDQKNPSMLAEDLEERLNLEPIVNPDTGEASISEDDKGYYHYPYLLTI